MKTSTITRRVAPVATALAILGVGLFGASTSSADLSSQKQSLEQGIASESHKISALAGRLDDLHQRMQAVDATLTVQEASLKKVQNEMVDASQHLKQLRKALKRDQKVLAAQMVAQYESPTPDLVGVVLTAHGFGDLLNQVSRMQTLAKHNAQIVAETVTEKSAVAAQTARLTLAHTRQLRITAATLSERDQVASLQLSILKEQRVAVAGRSAQQKKLAAVKHRLAVIQAKAEAAARASYAAADPSSDSYSGGGSASPSGGYGFFPAAGTNYTVGEEPEIAQRLNAMGIALHLHLIGISGYRSPQHSLEVGGFADDPHTRGEASDTPGVEGVPEATLERFGLTRPFPGPAEADHIQLA